MQGINVIVDIYAQAEAADDTGGGAVRSDAIRYAGVGARIANDRVPLEFRLQAIETARSMEIILYPDRYPDVRSEDIVIPRSGPWAKQRLRVTAVQRSSLPVGHPRSHIQLSAVHTDYANREE
ncbi:MAG: hypothetical protein MUO37_04940 [Methyloceanibacter sp.]|nr:hypothetical protein [Methyloceanibacter sp.]